MSGTEFISVGMAIVQVVLLVRGNSTGAGVAGVVAGLLDRLLGPWHSPRHQVRTGAQIAEEIKRRVPASSERRVPASTEEYRAITSAQWEAASQDVAVLLRNLPEKTRREAGYDAKALRKAVLEAGGQERRADLDDKEAKVAFDWLLGEACKLVVELFTDSDALRKIVDELDRMGDVLANIHEGQRRGQLVSTETREHAGWVRSLAPDPLLDREAEIAELKAFVMDGDAQWLAYTAPMGAGKTALMATFAHHPPRGVKVVSYFVRTTLASNNHSSFFFRIRAQLAEIIGDRYVYSVAQAEQRSALADALRVATAVCDSRGERLVLLIDGLDEDAYFKAREGQEQKPASILSVLPPDLPEHLRVMTASRPNPSKPTDVECHAWKAPVRRELSPSPHAEAEIDQETLNRFLCHEHGLTIGALLAASDGWLTIRDLSLLAGVRGEEAKPSAVKVFVQESAGRLLNVMEIGSGRNSVVAYALGHEKVLKEILKELAPADFGEGDDPDDEQWWAKLRFRILRPYRRTILAWARDRAAASGWSSNTPSYLLGDGYLSVIKQEEGEMGILNLLSQSDRNDAIVERLGSAYTAIRAIDEVLDAFLAYHESDLTEGYLGAILSVAEERRRLAEPHVYVPGLIGLRARYFDEDPNVLFAAILSLEDPAHRVRALREIAGSRLCGDQLRRYVDTPLLYEVAESVRHRTEKCSIAKCAEARILAAAGQVETARDAAMEAREVARTIEDPWRRSKALANVACALATAGQAVEAREVIRSIEEPSSRAEALVVVARALADAGYAVVAWETARSIKAPWLRAEVLAGVARALADAGYAVVAWETARSIEDPWLRAEALVGVVRALLTVGQAVEAWKAAHGIEIPWLRAETLVGVARALAAAGQAAEAQDAAAEAREAARRIENPERRAEALVGVAQALAAAGQAAEAQDAAAEARDAAAEAREAARTIEESRDRAEALVGVARALAAAGQTAEAQDAAAEAREAARRIENSWRRAETLVGVAQILAAAGYAAEAREVARAIEYPGRRAKALVGVVRTLAAAGQVAEAREAAGRIEDPGRRAEALVGVAQALAAAGYAAEARDAAAEAREAARRIEYQWWRAETLVGVARALAAAGYAAEAQDAAAEAREAARRIENSWRRAETLVGVARALAAAGYAAEARDAAAEAREAARRIEESRDRAEALVGVARALAAAGYAAEARDAAVEAREVSRRIEVPQWQAEALAGVARSLTDAGYAVEAREVSRRIENPGRRAEALAGVARSLTDAGYAVEAREVSRRIEVPQWQAEALAGVARSLTDAGHVEAERTASEALRAAHETDDSRPRTKVMAVVILALGTQDLSPKAEAVAADEFTRLRRRHAEDRGTRARSSIELARACSNVAEASPKTDQAAIDRWKSLARMGLGMAWMYGAEVWDGFDVLLGVAPDLAMDLVHERLLAEGESQES